MDLKSKFPARLWIPISDWMVNDIISNEILSPAGYYSKRNFGISALNFPDHKNRVIHSEDGITMFTIPYQFQPSSSKPVYILLKSDTLSKKYLHQVNENIFIYTRSIYLRRGNFQIRFYEETDLKLFKVRSKMSLEAKTLSKYLVTDFFENKEPAIIRFDESLKEKEILDLPKNIEQPKQVYQYFFDKAFNHIKGFIYGLIIGKINTKSEKKSGVTTFSTVKSMITGFKTRLIMAEDYSEDAFIALISRIEKHLPEEEKDFRYSIVKKIEEIKELQKLHFNVLTKQKENTKNVNEEAIGRLRQRLETLQNEKGAIKLSLDNSMKKRRGLEKQYKALGRPKKHTKEDDQKKELKEEIEEIKNHQKKIRFDHKEIRAAIISIEKELLPFENFGQSEYQSTIEDLFYRINRDLNQKILDAKKIKDLDSNLGDVDFLPDLVFSIEDVSRLANNDETSELESFHLFKKWGKKLFGFLEPEKEFLLFEKAINAIFANTQDSSSDVSIRRRDNIVRYFLSLLEEDNEFKEVVIEFQQFLSNRAESFNLSVDSAVLQNFFAFILKIQNNENLEAYLDAQKIDNKSIASIFYGAFLGFSNLPKTFTSPLFSNPENPILDKIDDYFFEYYLKVFS